MSTREQLLSIFEAAGAIRHGHFELSSGRHSDTYVQCALVLQYPRYAEKLGQSLAALFSDARIDVVVSPALGGVVIGQEVARALPLPNDPLGGGVPALFVERDASGTLTMRRGFTIKPDQHVLGCGGCLDHRRLDGRDHSRCSGGWWPRSGCGCFDRSQRRHH